MGYLDDLDPPKAKTTDGKGNQIMPDMDYKVLDAPLASSCDAPSSMHV